MLTEQTIASSVYLFSYWILYAECWTQRHGVRRYDGRLHSVTSLYECQTACVNDYECVAIDWKPNNSCWILNSTSNRPTDGVGLLIHYDLKRICLRS